MKHSVTSKSVSRETWNGVNKHFDSQKNLFSSYINRLLWWNKKINLISRGITSKDVEMHVKHSLFPIFLNLLDDTDFIIDIGTGGGLPGIPLKIALPSLQIQLNDISTKKVLAVREIIRYLKLDGITVQADDFKDLSLSSGHCIISKYAFKISDIITHINLNHLKKLILFKGNTFKDELEQVEIPLKIIAYNLHNIHPFFHHKSILVLQNE